MKVNFVVDTEWLHHCHFLGGVKLRQRGEIVEKRGQDCIKHIVLLPWA